jgi:hypothetical protein
MDAAFVANAGTVMAGQSRPKDGVASLACVPVIYASPRSKF